MPRYRIINNERVQFTAEEETARDTEENQEAVNKQAKIDDETAKTNNRTSGKTKLKSGDALTDAEISALFGDN
tara:strand:+ start:546 stop:764 length:219 start_codon:yes stop_codon:yes gene_type:complete